MKSAINYEYLHDAETRTTDYATGGQKGVKLTQVGALDPIALIEIGRVAGMGANKYSAFNYLQGFDWAHAYNAMQRHANLFWSGEDRDPESDLPHIAHAAWMALALVSFYLRGIGTDTRPPVLTGAGTFAPKPVDQCCACAKAVPHDGDCHWCERHTFVTQSPEALSPEEMQDWLNEFFGSPRPTPVTVGRPEPWGTGDGPICDRGRTY